MQRLIVDAQLPTWVIEHLGQEGSHVEKIGNVQIGSIEGNTLCILRAEVDGADSLCRTEFEQCVTDAFSALLTFVPDVGVTHVARFWNYLPNILFSYGDGFDRYMAFNIGREKAFRPWVEKTGNGKVTYPASTAVGHSNSSLVSYMLITQSECHSVENPRQKSAYHYSPQFGPQPPSFSRATVTSLVPGERHLIISGTASIIGENTAHLGDIDMQLAEIVQNIQQVISSSFAPSTARFVHLRVYHREGVNTDHVLHYLYSVFPDAECIEAVPAEFCRAGLLVEIEALAVWHDEKKE